MSRAAGCCARTIVHDKTTAAVIRNTTLQCITPPNFRASRTTWECENIRLGPADTISAPSPGQDPSDSRAEIPILQKYKLDLLPLQLHATQRHQALVPSPKRHHYS